ncbi:MAG: DMT family transporter [Planctomycetes bacterium]|nr:DMT family transporter [Planctomycetota bacterium]
MPFLALLAVLLGAAVCLQSTVNGQLAGRIGLPLTLAINSGVVFAGALVWYAIARWSGNTPTERLPAPWFLFTGGLFGLVIISCAAVAYPRLGAGTTTTLAVGTQVVVALVLDQLGATGRHVPLTPSRLLGVALVALGVWLSVSPPRAS